MPIDPADVVGVATLGKLDLDRGLAPTIQQVVDAAEQLLAADGVGLMLADNNGQLRWTSASNQQVQNIEEHQDRTALGLCAAAYAKRAPMSVRDVHQDPDSYGLRWVLSDAQLVAVLSVPVELDGDPIGTLIGLCHVGAGGRPVRRSHRGAGRLHSGQAPAQQASRTCSSPSSCHKVRPTPPVLGVAAVPGSESRGRPRPG